MDCRAAFSLGASITLEGGVWSCSHKQHACKCGQGPRLWFALQLRFCRRTGFLKSVAGVLIIVPLTTGLPMMRPMLHLVFPQSASSRRALLLYRNSLCSIYVLCLSIK
jgi:hypothetical protein